MRTLKTLLLCTGIMALASCDRIDDFVGDGGGGSDEPGGTIFENKSNLEPLVSIMPQFNFVKAYSLISTSDVLPGNFQIAGAADGAGFLEDPESDGYIYMLNCEDDYSVVRIKLDKYLNPISGEYVLNSGVADFARQCSGTMWERDIHGGAQDLYLSASENFNYDVKGLDPYQAVPTPTADFGLDALGEFHWENAVPLPRDAYNGKTVIIGGDDDSSGSEGQVTLYYSENGDGDLNNGDVYVLRAKQVSDGAGGIMEADPTTTYTEENLDYGVAYDVEFVKIENGGALTREEMEVASDEVFALHFMRVEDVDYQKGSDANGRNVYFAVTGRGPGRDTYNDWGTVYKLALDEDSPMTGKLTQVISGNTDTNNMDGNLPTLQSPDNICVTENFIYTQEDPNSFSRGHTAYIYQSDLNGNSTRVVMEFVVRSDLAKDGTVGGGSDTEEFDRDSGEYGSLIDISDKVGEPGTFLLALQPHYWESDDFLNLDGHDLRSNPGAIAAAQAREGFSPREDDQGSQVLIIKGLPR
ncbi:MAG: hypothetical protein AAFX53_02490 [Bacteroidota bacterium]